MTTSSVNLDKIIQHNEIISQSSQSSCHLSIQSDGIQEIPKKKLHPLIFLLNVFWMLFCCHCNLYYVYGSGTEMPRKGTVAAIALGVTVVVALPTFFYITSIKGLFKLTFLIDTIMVLTLAAAVAFVNLILLFDNNDDWFWTVMESGFSIEMVFYSTMTRVLLVHMKWSKWQLIVFKFHAMTNCLMFLISGVYFIWVDFTYTQHFLVAFDSKVHDFMLLFIFTLFSYTYQIYAKITDLDHTGELRYIYALKNMDQNLTKKKNSIIQKKRQSVMSINLLRKSVEIPKGVMKPFRTSRFAKIQVL